jgi:NADH dehydrogenase
MSVASMRRKARAADDGDALPATRWFRHLFRHTYFATTGEPFAPGLKTLEDATTLRRRILVAFERAERGTDGAARR